MHLFDPATISHILSTYGYAAIFAVIMLESAGIPMPGETILIAAAVLAGTKHSLDIRWVIAAAAVAAIIGDNIGFWVGRAWGGKLLARYGPAIGLDTRKQKLGHYLFRRYGGAIVFVGRFAALLRTYAALLAGINGLAPLKFLAWNAAGGIVWAGLFGVGGYLIGKGIERFAGAVGWIALALAIIGGVALWLFYKKHEERLLQAAETEMTRQDKATAEA